MITNDFPWSIFKPSQAKCKKIPFAPFTFPDVYVLIYHAIKFRKTAGLTSNTFFVIGKCLFLIPGIVENLLQPF